MIMWFGGLFWFIVKSEFVFMPTDVDRMYPHWISSKAGLLEAKRSNPGPNAMVFKIKIELNLGNNIFVFYYFK